MIEDNMFDNLTELIDLENKKSLSEEEESYRNELRQKVVGQIGVIVLVGFFASILIFLSFFI